MPSKSFRPKSLLLPCLLGGLLLLCRPLSAESPTVLFTVETALGRLAGVKLQWKNKWDTTREAITDAEGVALFPSDPDYGCEQNPHIVEIIEMEGTVTASCIRAACSVVDGTKLQLVLANGDGAIEDMGGFLYAPAAVDGGWSEWTACGGDFADCAPGTEGIQTRTCNNPLPVFGGKNCEGPASQACTVPRPP